MRYYIIAGEASGDLHGSNLMRGLKNVDPKPAFRFWGGDKMQGEGGELVKHYADYSIMGFWEVITKAGKIIKFLRNCKKDLLQYNPDVLILVDFPGFNLQMAKFAKKHNIQVFYYISPKIWAWKESRIKKIKAYVDRMFIIFPFEQDFYKKHNYIADFYGNPLVDAIDEKLVNRPSFDWFIRENDLDNRPVIAVLPGSRKQEIDRNLSVMLDVAPDFSDHQFVIAGAPSIESGYYGNYLIAENIRIIYNKTYDLLSNAKAAIVTSGTATLEAALFGVPQMVCYKANPLSYLIAKSFVKVPYISLVNLNMDKEVVKEFIQSGMNVENIRSELYKILYDRNYIAEMMEDYKSLHNVLGGKGASERIAKAMVDYLKQ
ncbi:MAG: lipid-A-disaccharide synthase [Bacteroidales bacterium]